MTLIPDDHGERFEWGSLFIRQSDNVFKVGTDAIILGSWIPTIIEDASRIFDIGTGTGILALKMSLSYPRADIDAIDSDECAHGLANYNIMQNGLEGKLTARNASVFDFHELKKKTYDLVICNPPFFFNQIHLPSNRLSHAKHATHTAPIWMKALSERMASEGHICLVLPYEITFEWIRTANENGLFVQNRLEVYSFENNPYPKRSLLHFSDHLVKSGLERLTVYRPDGRETSKYLEFTGIKRPLFQKD